MNLAPIPSSSTSVKCWILGEAPTPAGPVLLPMPQPEMPWRWNTYIRRPAARSLNKTLRSQWPGTALMPPKRIPALASLLWVCFPPTIFMGKNPSPGQWEPEMPKEALTKHSEAWDLGRCLWGYDWGWGRTVTHHSHWLFGGRTGTRWRCPCFYCDANCLEWVSGTQMITLFFLPSLDLFFLAPWKVLGTGEPLAAFSPQGLWFQPCLPW